MKKKTIKLIAFLLILIVVLSSVYVIVRLNVIKVRTVDKITSEKRTLAKATYDKLTRGGKIDKQKFEKVYRAAKTLTATIEGGISYLKLQELNQNFLTEISIAGDNITAEKEKEVIALYKRAYSNYSISETVWEAIIRYNLDNYGHQYPYKSKLIFEKLKPIIDEFGLILIPKQTEYDGIMYRLPKSELSKIWVIAEEDIDRANAIVIGRASN